MAARVVFFGNEELATGVRNGAHAFRALAKHPDYEVVALVLSQREKTASRKASSNGMATQLIAMQHDIPVLFPEKLSEANTQIKELGAEIAVLAAYGRIVPQSTIDLFPRGIVNIHPSLLPKHRGSAPLESVILQGESRTGVSLMQLVQEMDAGPVYAQRAVGVTNSVIKKELAESLSSLAADLLIEKLPAILDGSLQPKPQDDSEATYDSRIEKNAGILDFVTKNAAQLEREVRAYAGWPRSRCSIGTTEVVITSAHVTEANGTPGTLWLNGKQIGMHCQTGVLVFDTLVPSGKKEMTASAFMAGYRP